MFIVFNSIGTSTRTGKKSNAPLTLVSGEKRKLRQTLRSRPDDAMETSSSDEIPMSKRKKANLPATPKQAAIPKTKDNSQSSQKKAAAAGDTKIKDKGKAVTPSRVEKDGMTFSYELCFPASFEALEIVEDYFL